MKKKEAVLRKTEDLNKPSVYGHENYVDSSGMDISDKMPTDCEESLDDSENLKDTQDIDTFSECGIFHGKNLPSNAENERFKIICGELKNSEAEVKHHTHGTDTDSEKNGPKYVSAIKFSIILFAFVFKP